MFFLLFVLGTGLSAKKIVSSLIMQMTNALSFLLQAILIVWWIIFILIEDSIFYLLVTLSNCTVNTKWNFLFDWFNVIMIIIFVVVSSVFLCVQIYSLKYRRKHDPRIWIFLSSESLFKIRKGIRSFFFKRFYCSPFFVLYAVENPGSPEKGPTDWRWAAAAALASLFVVGSVCIYKGCKYLWNTKASGTSSAPTEPGNNQTPPSPSSAAETHSSFTVSEHSFSNPTTHSTVGTSAIDADTLFTHLSTFDFFHFNYDHPTLLSFLFNSATFFSLSSSNVLLINNMPLVDFIHILELVTQNVIYTHPEFSDGLFWFIHDYKTINTEFFLASHESNDPALILARINHVADRFGFWGFVFSDSE